VWLVDPTGQAQAFQSNSLVTADASGQLSATNVLGVNANVLDPVAGLWTIIVTFAPTVSGTALSEPFTLSVSQTAPVVSAVSVPKGRAISVNRPVVSHVRVVNTGTAPEAYFIDPRTTATAQYPLAALTGADTTVPLSAYGTIPVYLVPSETSSIVAAAQTSGTGPIQFDVGAPTGDPDLASGQGLSVSTEVDGSPLTAGEWDIAPDVVGPFGATGAPAEPVATTMTATTQGFDPSVTTSAGDLWLASIGGAAPVSPIIVYPGKSAIIPVIFAPTQPAGTAVTGTLYVDEDSLFSLYGALAPDANTVAAIPYSYVSKG
jgi:hypothetical protein